MSLPPLGLPEYLYDLRSMSTGYWVLGTPPIAHQVIVYGLTRAAAAGLTYGVAWRGAAWLGAA